MDKVRVLCAISLLLAHIPYLSCMEVAKPVQRTKYQKKMRDIIIISDPEKRLPEEHSDPTLWFLVRAINESAVPILVSITIWNNFVKRRNLIHKKIQEDGSIEQKVFNMYETIELEFNRLLKEKNGSTQEALLEINELLKLDKVNTDFQEGYKKLKNDFITAVSKTSKITDKQKEMIEFLSREKKQKTVTEKIRLEITQKRFELQYAYVIKKNISCYKTLFNPMEWDMYLHNGYVLLIPEKYKKRIKDSSVLLGKIPNFTDRINNRLLTKDELELGIKINNLKKITIDSSQNLSLLAELEYSLKEEVFFVNKSDIVNELDRKDYLLLWNIILIGHGSFGLTPDNIKKVKQTVLSLQQVKKDIENQVGFFIPDFLLNIKKTIDKNIKTNKEKIVVLTKKQIVIVLKEQIAILEENKKRKDVDVKDISYIDEQIKNFKVRLAELKGDKGEEVGDISVISKQINRLKEYNKKLENIITYIKSNLSKIYDYDKKLYFDMINSIISGLKIYDFKRFLRFAQYDIFTNFLYYSTCYPGALHFSIPYSTLGIQDIYSFIIVAGGLSDTATDLTKSVVSFLKPFLYIDKVIVSDNNYQTTDM